MLSGKLFISLLLEDKRTEARHGKGFAGLPKRHFG